VKQLFVCEICHQANIHHEGTYIVNGTNAITRHLTTKHGIAYDNYGNRIYLPVERPLSSSAWKKPGKGTARKDVQRERPFDTDGFLRATVDWSIKQDITYRQLTSEDTRDMLSYDRDYIDPAVWKSPCTLSKMIISQYYERIPCIRDLLLTAKSKIHLSWDIWSSTNGFSLLGIVSHFLGY
jgi:hypothetical protein